MPGDAAPTAPRASAEPLASAYDVALLDLDGVVYIGSSAVAGAADSLAKAKAGGMRVAFVTNNASRTPSAIAAQLAGLGVPAGAADVITSAQAGARLLAERLVALGHLEARRGAGYRRRYGLADDPPASGPPR